MRTKQVIKEYTNEQVYRNYLIKVFGIVDGKKVNTLVGIPGLLKVLKGDRKKMMAMITRAFASGKDRTDCKIYNGAKVSFYIH